MGFHRFADTGSIGIIIDGGGSAITTGLKGYLYVPFGGIIQSVTLLGDVAGTCEIDIWARYFDVDNRPIIDNTIIGESGTLPVLSGNTAYQDEALTDWTISFPRGTEFAFYVNNAATLTRVTLILKVLKS